MLACIFGAAPKEIFSTQLQKTPFKADADCCQHGSVDSAARSQRAYAPLDVTMGKKTAIA